MPIHEAQILTYMKLANVLAGRLMNFNVEHSKDGGIKRFVLQTLRVLRGLCGRKKTANILLEEMLPLGVIPG